MLAALILAFAIPAVATPGEPQVAVSASQATAPRHSTPEVKSGGAGSDKWPRNDPMPIAEGCKSLRCTNARVE
jgi:hypothetical protein